MNELNIGLDFVKYNYFNENIALEDDYKKIYLDSMIGSYSIYKAGGIELFIDEDNYFNTNCHSYMEFYKYEVIKDELVNNRFLVICVFWNKVSSAYVCYGYTIIVDVDTGSISLESSYEHRLFEYKDETLLYKNDNIGYEIINNCYLFGSYFFVFKKRYVVITFDVIRLGKYAALAETNNVNLLERCIVNNIYTTHKSIIIDSINQDKQHIYVCIYVNIDKNNKIRCITTNNIFLYLDV